MLKAWNYIVPKEMVKLTVRQLIMGVGANVESEAVRNIIEVSVDIDFSSVPVRSGKSRLE